MNLNESFTAMTKAANDNYANLRKLADLNLATWDRLVAKQMEMMTLCVDAGVKQYEAAQEAKRVDEILGKQTEMARECGDKMLQKNREMLDLLVGTRDEYQHWLEDSVSRIKDQLAPETKSTRNTARKAA